MPKHVQGSTRPTCFQSSKLSFFSVVGALKSNKSLQELDLTSNRLNSYQDALHLGDMLRYNSTLVTLSLNSNSIADDGRIVSESEFALHN